MHRVVLLSDIIQVFSDLIDPILSKHVVQEQEGEVVWVLMSRSIIEYAHIGVVHLIISHEHQGRDEDTLVSVLLLPPCLLLYPTEAVLHLLHQLVVVDVPTPHHHNVVSEVVRRVVLLQLLNRNVKHVVPVSLLWLAQHVVSESIVVHILHCGLQVVLVTPLVLLTHFLLHQLKLLLVVLAV